MFYRLKKKVTAKYREATPIQLLVSYYAIATIVTFFLLCLPWIKQPNAPHTTLLDNLFMAVSTISVTGLSTFPIDQVYNEYGVILLELLFQVGGFGVTMLVTVAMVLTGRRIGLHQRQLIQFDMNQPKLSGMVKLVTSVFGLMIVVQVIFGLLFSIYFVIKGVYHNFYEALFHGMYISISAVTNAGFDVTGDSIIPFRYDHIFLLIIMILVIIGSIGYPVLTEIEAWLFYKFSYKGLRKFRFSLFCKLAVFFAILFTVGGTILLFLSENNGFALKPDSFDNLMSAMFYSVSSRNAGLQINSMNDFNHTTLLLLALLMFIGASPSSVGGGVRTTTIGILILYLYSFIRGRNNINIFNRRISSGDIQKAIVVVSLSTLLCVSAVLILSATEKAPLLALVFEVASAFGTTGLSLGITESLSIVGKIVIMVLMFIGRIGMLYTLMFFIRKRDRDLSYKMPSEKIIIG